MKAKLQKIRTNLVAIVKQWPKKYWISGAIVALICGSGITFALVKPTNQKNAQASQRVVRKKHLAPWEKQIEAQEKRDAQIATEKKKGSDPLETVTGQELKKELKQATAKEAVQPEYLRNLEGAITSQNQKEAERKEAAAAPQKNSMIGPAIQTAKESDKSKLTKEPAVPSNESPSPSLPTVASVNYSRLAVLVNQGRELSESAFFTESYARFHAEWLISKEMVQAQRADQATVDAEAIRLELTMNQLIPRGNKQELGALLEQIQGLAREEYTTATIHVVDQAYQTAKQTMDTADVTQTQVNEQVNALQAALEQLVQRGDKTSLIQELDQVKELRAADYTSKSAQHLNEVFKASEVVNKNVDALQSDIDQAVHALKEAVNQLVKRGNKTKLNHVLESAEQIDRDSYTSETLTLLDQAIASGKVVQKDLDATQPEVDHVLTQLHEALDGLKKIDEPALSLLALRRLITDCETLKETDYTPGTFTPFKEELEKAIALVTQLPLTKEAVQNKIQALQQAKDQLMKRADKTQLQTLITASEALQEGDYTSESWQLFEAALTNAKSILLDLNATQAQVDSVVTVLQQAKEQLALLNE